jgi:hypothetical protein
LIFCSGLPAWAMFGAGPPGLCSDIHLHFALSLPKTFLATLNDRSAGSLILRCSFRSQPSGDNSATLNNGSAGALILSSGLAGLCLVPAVRACIRTSMFIALSACRREFSHPE